MQAEPTAACSIPGATDRPAGHQPRPLAHGQLLPDAATLCRSLGCVCSPTKSASFIDRFKRCCCSSSWWTYVESVVFRKPAFAVSRATLPIMEKMSPRLAYETPYLAKLVHSFPRFDLSLHRVNATFLLDSHNYKEVPTLATWCSHADGLVERLSSRNRNPGSTSLGLLLTSWFRKFRC